MVLGTGIRPLKAIKNTASLDAVFFCGEKTCLGEISRNIHGAGNFLGCPVIREIKRTLFHCFFYGNIVKSKTKNVTDHIKGGKKMKNKIWQVVLIVCLVIIVISGINIYRLSREYQKGINEYAALEKYVSIETEPAVQEPAAQEEAVEEETKESVIPISIDVQYDELKAINEGFVAWLYYEPLELSYPVVRGDDNEYYTKYTFENVQNSSGAIFMDFLNRKDFSDYNTIIYGHNMKNGTMFGSLKKLLSNQDMIEENPYFYIFTENKAFMYEIFAMYITTSDSHTYDLVNDEEAQQEYLDYIRDTAVYLSDKEVLAEDRIVTLSTCHGLHTNNRTVVHGVLIAEEDR